MITIQFDFKNREAEDLQQINGMLAGLKLRDLDIEDFRGYLATTRDESGNLLDKRYGLDEGKLICKEASADQHGYTYQIDTLVVDDAAGMAHQEILDTWRASYPDRTLRIAITLGFDDCKAYVIAHHDKWDGPDEDDDDDWEDEEQTSPFGLGIPEEDDDDEEIPGREGKSLFERIRAFSAAFGADDDEDWELEEEDEPGPF